MICLALALEEEDKRLRPADARLCRGRWRHVGNECA